jgi:hypothetical protein
MKERLKKRKLSVATLSIVILAVAAVAIASGGASARSPGNCYCQDYEPAYSSGLLVDETNAVVNSGCGGNYWQTSPYDIPSTGEVGADQYSESCGPAGNHEMVTSLGWESPHWTTDFISGDPVTFEFNWNINWASEISALIDPGDCGGSGSGAAEIALSANIYDVTTAKWEFSTAWTSVIYSGGDSSIGSPFNPTGYSLFENLSWSTVSGFNTNDQYYMVGLVVLETESIVDASCGDIQSYMNVDSATLFNMEWYSS